jgi:hypothetical protein
VEGPAGVVYLGRPGLVFPMLVIRNEQMAALSRARKDRFKARLAAELPAAHPVELASVDAAGVRALVDAGVERAERYAIDTEEGIRRYVGLTVVHGAAFEERPDYGWARTVLERKDLPADTRVDQVEKIAVLMGRG